MIEQFYCRQGHAYREHGRIDDHGRMVCLKCIASIEKKLAAIREQESRTFMGYAQLSALSELGRRWDDKIRRFASTRGSDAACKHFGIELRTVQAILADE